MTEEKKPEVKTIQDPMTFRKVNALLFIGDDKTMLNSSDFALPPIFNNAGFSVLNALLDEHPEHVFMLEYPDNGPLQKFDRETDQWEFPIKGARYGLKILIGTNNEVDFQGSQLSIKRDGQEHVVVTFYPGPNVPEDVMPTMLGYSVTAMTEYDLYEGMDLNADRPRRLVKQ